MSILETVLSHDTVVPMKKLTDITTTEDATTLELDMRGNTWADHTFVVLRFTPANALSQLSCRVNNDSSYAVNIPWGTTGLTPDLFAGSCGPEAPWTLLFFPFHRNSDSNLAGLGVSDSLYRLSVKISFSSVTKLTFRLNSDQATFAAGTKLEIWGIL